MAMPSWKPGYMLQVFKGAPVIKVTEHDAWVIRMSSAAAGEL